MTTGQILPVRVYRSSNRIMVAAPMPGLEPTDITVTVDGDRVTIEGRERGPRQHNVDLVLAEWTVGPYRRELELIEPVAAELVNATYDNGVLVLAMPTLEDGRPASRAEIRLEPIEATRGEYVRHVGRDITPTTTRQHRVGKHRTGHAGPPPADPQDVAPPAK
jgi:HSP20 family protein